MTRPSGDVGAGEWYFLSDHVIPNFTARDGRFPDHPWMTMPPVSQGTSKHRVMMLVLRSTSGWSGVKHPAHSDSSFPQPHACRIDSSARIVKTFRPMYTDHLLRNDRALAKYCCAEPARHRHRKSVVQQVVDRWPAEWEACQLKPRSKDLFSRDEINDVVRRLRTSGGRLVAADANDANPIAKDD